MVAQKSKLKAGDFIEVRSKEEILGTLDRNGCLDGLPFMPEMFKHCGQRLRVFKRAHKTCDTINWSGSRRLIQTVHLEDIRCTGQAHGGCQAECLIFWKEAWLKRPAICDTKSQASPPSVGRQKCTEAEVVAACRRPQQEENPDPVYSCQATQMLQASSPLSTSDWHQYWEDFASGNCSLGWMLGVACYALHYSLLQRSKPGGRFRRILYWIYSGVQLIRGRPRIHPRATGKIPPGAPTPSAKLNLQPGELVRIKSFDEIRKTIDEDYKNRGMKWDAELVPYCGGTYRVKKRVERIIDEKTGRMMGLKSDAIILENVFCRSGYSNCRYFCPRSIYPYWREIWLERVSEPKAEPLLDNRHNGYVNATPHQ